MEYIGLVFGIFGILAYVQISSLQKRVVALEEEIAGIAGTSAYEERRSLMDVVNTYIGKPVVLEQKKDCQDVDVMMYGNTKNGSNTILEADGDWMLVRIDSPKGSMEKLIRVGSIQRISLVS